jgi:hypothetical protein
MIKVVVKVRQPSEIALKAFDANQANTYFTDRTKKITDQETLYIRMPLAPKTLTVSIYNKANGNRKKGEDNSFEIVEIKREELDVTLGRTKMDTPMVRNFVAFAQKFCYNCGWMPVGRDFTSTAGNFKIEYLPFIVSSKGEKMATPARVSTKNGRIQVSQQAFLPFTIPMRMAILLHEFSHYYINTEISNETEADLNGLFIYLALGYPRIEGGQAWGKVAYNYPTEENDQRVELIQNFISDFDKSKMIVY